MKDKCISTYYQPKTGAKCYCKRGAERDNCPNCEGTGWIVDFRAIRERNNKREEKTIQNILDEEV